MDVYNLFEGRSDIYWEKNKKINKIDYGKVLASTFIFDVGDQVLITRGQSMAEVNYVYTFDNGLRIELGNGADDHESPYIQGFLPTS